ncbi:cobalamin biosynthesis protein, partial [Streptomyces sp. JJ36]|uniref:cobalamin biosynthesis protein n=1 Tax=Streptomyces sp. JJ36 TaxID=2736645 RepID=UPI001EFF6988
MPASPPSAGGTSRRFPGGPYVTGAALGFLADLVLGDPRRAHPVAAFGRAAARLEDALWRDHRGPGALHTALCVGGAAAAAHAAEHA